MIVTGSTQEQTQGARTGLTLQTNNAAKMSPEGERAWREFWSRIRAALGPIPESDSSRVPFREARQ